MGEREPRESAIAASGCDEGAPPDAHAVFTFVVDEIARFQEHLNAGKIRSIDIYDILTMLGGSRGRQRIIGRKALSELYRLSNFEISRNPKLTGRVNADKLVAHLRESILEEIDNPTTLSASDILRLNANRLVDSLSSERNFYFPCKLPRQSRISKFHIGPVKFRRKDDFYIDIADICDDRDLLKEYDAQYTEYNWIASVCIKDFDFEKGHQRASLFVKLAIVGLKICFKESFSKWMGSIDQLNPRLAQYYAHEDCGRVYVGSSRTFALAISEENLSEIFENRHDTCLRKCGNFLNQYIDRGDFGFLGGKIISALTWMDTGTTPSFPAQRILAYSNVLEVLFVTSDRGVSSQIRRRAAPLLSVYDPDRDWEKLVRDFYRVRSELVHGSVSPVYDKLDRHVALGADLAGKAIVSMMEFCGWLLQRYPADATPRDVSPFGGAALLSDAFERHLSEFVAECRDR